MLPYINVSASWHVVIGGGGGGCGGGGGGGGVGGGVGGLVVGCCTIPHPSVFCFLNPQSSILSFLFSLF